MERLRDDHRFPTVKRAVRFCALRLGSRPELGECAAVMTRCRADLRSREETWEDAVDARVASTAEVTWCDQRLDQAVSSLARDVNVLVEGRTDDPRYRRLFLVAPSDGMRPVGGDAQGRFVRNLLDTLESDDAFVNERKHAAMVRARQGALDTAVARRDALQLAEQRARRELDIAAEQARATYNQMTHRVALVYPDDATLVDSFFWSASVAGATKEEEAPAPAPVPLSGALPEGVATAAVVQQPANESAKSVRQDKRSRRRRRTA